jgi:hypothetical protein
MKVTLKSTVGVLRHNNKEYGPGDKVEMTKEEAAKIQHHIEEAEELFGEPKPKARDLDDPDRLV